MVCDYYDKIDMETNDDDSVEAFYSMFTEDMDKLKKLTSKVEWSKGKIGPIEKHIGNLLVKYSNGETTLEVIEAIFEEMVSESNSFFEVIRNGIKQTQSQCE